MDRPELSVPPPLPKRVLRSAWAALAIASAIAWWLTLRDASAMHHGHWMGTTMGMNLVAFLGMWTLMMAAMMLPSVGPVTGAWLRLIRRESEGRGQLTRTSLFVAGYLLAWATSGVVIFLLCTAIDESIAQANVPSWWIASGVLGVAGAWQLSPWKDTCLRHCRSPLASLAHYVNWRGPAIDLRIGLHHGLFCVGCCAGLMLVLIATGLMHLGAMLMLTVMVFTEKIWRHGELLGRVAGFALLAAACAAPWLPAIRPGLPG